MADDATDGGSGIGPASARKSRFVGKRTFAAVALVGALLLLAGLAAALVFYRDSGPSDPTLSAAVGAGDYLVRHTNADGSFVYEVDPVKGRVSAGYNILRHAGTSYAMLELYEVTRDAALLGAAERALSYLEAQAQPCPDFPQTLCVVEDREIKLGGNGLAVLAFAKHAEVTGNESHLGTAVKLARWMTATQSRAGEFTKHRITTGGKPDEFISEFYPGEALFALARLSVRTGNREWIEAAHRGAAWIINVRDRGKTTDQIARDHWFLYALNELHADRASAEYVAHARVITEAIVMDQHQTQEGAQQDWNGGYGDPPRSTPAATRSEGLSAALRIFRRAGDKEYERKALQALERGIEFQLRTQMTAAKADELHADAASIGGFHESLDEYGIRIDYVQHNLSALLAYRSVR
ncbi:MAG: hypothetical protein ACR2HN_00545 [Tepidiformaceae bacterium]